MQIEIKIQERNMEGKLIKKYKNQSTEAGKRRWIERVLLLLFLSPFFKNGGMIRS